MRIETCADDAGSGQATRLNRSKRVAEKSGSDVGHTLRLCMWIYVQHNAIGQCLILSGHRRLCL